MRLRPYIHALDFDVIKNWITDPRAHAMWSANQIPFPLEKASFEAALEAVALKSGDAPFVATADDGEAIGFFCYAVSPESREGKLKFVVVSPEYRGRGYGREMLALAVKYAFEFTGADAVQLNVFPENAAALRCYQRAGFAQRTLTEGAFAFGDERWGRCSMVIRK